MTDSDGGRPRASSGGSSDSDDSDVVVERLPPNEAFELLAHDLRFRVLETLNEADEPLAFSELRVRVGVDDPGRFNYHLGKLTDRFVRSDAEGYELATSGRRVVGAVLSGGYTKALDADPVETDAACLLCGSEMETRFRDDGIEIQCRECDSSYTNTPIPAGIFDGVAPEDVPPVVDRWLKRIHSTADYGFCHNCDGEVDFTIVVAGGENVPEWLDEEGADEEEAAVRYECERCNTNWYSSFSYYVVFHPAVVGFYYEHGVDVRTTPYWDLDGIGPDAATVVSREPLRIDLSVALGAETAVFTFDEDLNVVEERRK